MNDLKTVSISILRQVIAGFFFTTGGLLALKIMNHFFHLGICP